MRDAIKRKNAVAAIVPYLHEVIDKDVHTLPEAVLAATIARLAWSTQC